MANKKPNIRKCLTDQMLPYKGKKVALLLSSGLDSNALLFAMLEAGVIPVIYSFTLDDRESRDFRIARETAKIFNLKFVPLIISTDLEEVKKNLVSTIHTLNARGKSAVECLYAYKFAVDHIKEKYITSGLSADIYFVLSKKGCMHYKDKPDEYRVPRFHAVKGPDSQTSKLKVYCKSNGKEWLSPWLTDAMLKQFVGTSWDDVNKPKQKNPIHEQFSEYLSRCRTYQHTNLQLGDSGISELYAKLLLDSEWNPGLKAKSMVSIYNRIYKKELPNARPKTKSIF